MEAATLFTKFENTEEDWTGLSDQKKRKQLQNRINQRASRTRKLQAQLAAILPSHGRVTDSAGPQLLEGNTIILSRSPSFNLCQDAPLSSVEWDILLFARNTLWQQPCNPRHWGHSEPSAVSRSFDELWERRLLEVPVMRHSVILATCYDLEYLTGRDYTTIRLRHANATIRQIMYGLSKDNSTHPRESKKIRQDDILFAIMSLAKTSRSTSITPSAGTFGLFDPPFPIGLQFLNLWGQQESDPTHCMAMQHIIRSRAQLAYDLGIETPGFAEALYQFDLLESAKTLNRPYMPVPIVCHKLLKKEIGVRRSETEVQESFIQAVPRISKCRPLLDIFCYIQLYCSGIQSVQDRMGPGSTVILPYPTSMRDFTTLRDTIEHRLLAYNPVDNSTEEQICWAVAVIFTHCVIYPLPNRGPLDTLLDRLIAMLQILDEHDDGAVDGVFLVWVSMIGAMACQPTDEDRRGFFLESLTSFTLEMGILSWIELKSILHDFLWLDRACETGGLTIWKMVSSSPPETVGPQRRNRFDSDTGGPAQQGKVRTLMRITHGACTASAAPMRSAAFLSTYNEGH